MRPSAEEVLRRLPREALALLDRLTTVGFISSGVVLAAQTFLALFPLLMATTAFFPAEVSDQVAATLHTRLGLSGTTDDSVQYLVGQRSELRGGIGVVGAIVVLASATSFTRALQRVYEQSWGLPRLGLRGSLRGLVWLAGLVVYLVLLTTAVRFAGHGPAAPVTRSVITAIGTILLWWWTPFVLLLGRVRLRALSASGLLTGISVLVLGRVSTVVVPRTVRTNERRYGTIGVFFAIESWLVVIGCTIVIAAVAGAVLAQTGGPLGRWIRGAVDPDGWRREPTRRRRAPALPETTAD
ncbi:MAG TPA: YhjD/YihY/BrkB family envelope integrity protein [Micromonosporaceae bacterium]